MAMCTFFIAGAQNQTMDFHKFELAPTIDGDVSDWSNIWTTIPLKGSGATGAKTSDRSAKFQIGYDDTPNNSSGQPWNDDCIEVYLSVDTTDVLVVAPYRTQLRISRDGETITNQVINLDVDTFSTDEFYIIEMAIPWVGLYESQGEKFTSINDVTHLRFEIQVADCV